MSDKPRTGVKYAACAAFEDPVSIQRAYETAEYYLSLEVGRATNDQRRYIVQYCKPEERRDNTMFIAGEVEVRLSAVIALLDANDCAVGEHILCDMPGPSTPAITAFVRDKHGLARRIA